MSTEPNNEPTVSDICNALGRKRIAERVGRRTTAVSNAASEEVFPASWYIAIREMCDAKGIPCPDRLFSFIPAVGDAAETDGDPTEEDAA